MADDMEIDLPVKIETDSDESENENGDEQINKMDEDKVDNAVESTENTDKDETLPPDPVYLELAECGIKKRVAREFAKVIGEGKLRLSDLDERARKFVGNLKAEDGVQFANHLGLMMSCRQGVEEAATREEFLRRQMSLLRTQLKKQNRAYLTEPVGGPDHDKIAKLLQRTGYNMSFVGSQRSYGGPPPDWEGDEPICENNVYISGLPKDMYEDELVPILEQCGRIWMLRLVVSPLNNFSRGFCFLTYCTNEEAQRAVEQLNNFELRDGHTMKANLNNAHSTLFVKSLPNDKTDQEIREEFGSKTGGLTHVKVLRCTACPELEGIPTAAFLSFSSQKHLAVAKRTLAKGETPIFGGRLDISQADARGKPADDCLNQITEIHVHDMPESMDAGELRTKFGEYGEVKRVSKAGDHAIVFFVEPEAALKAMAALKGTWRQTSTVFFTKENEERYATNSVPASTSPYFCTVETSLGQEFGKIIADVSMGQPHHSVEILRQNARRKAEKQALRRGVMRGRGGRGAASYGRGRGMEKGRRGLLPPPLSAHRPAFRGGLMPTPHFGYDYGDFGGFQPPVVEHWKERWGDFDLPSAVGPWERGRGRWQERGGFMRGTGMGPNMGNSAGWGSPYGKKQARNPYQ